MRIDDYQEPCRGQGWGSAHPYALTTCVESSTHKSAGQQYQVGEDLKAPGGPSSVALFRF